MNIDIKLIFAIFSSLVYIISFLPYLRDIFLKKTKPHAYTWLIWSITQGTATAGMILGGGGWGAGALFIGTLIVFLIFLISLKYGTKNITKRDTIILIAAISAVFVWWQTKNPLLSVFMVSVIDFLGFIPSFRKTFEEPWTETIISWAGASLANFLSMLALSEYNLITLTYLVTITIGNVMVLIICFKRRKIVPRPA